MLATVAYDSPDAGYTFSIAKSREALTEAGIESAYVLLTGNCHVDDARNDVVATFLESSCTDLVFLDADVIWDAQDLVKLCQFDVDVVGGVYPYRREGRDKMPFRSKPGAEIVNGLLEVSGLPTGFLRVRRYVLEDMQKDFYQSRDFAAVPLIFERTLEEGTRWGGDLNFCNKLSVPIYAATEIRLGHAARVVYEDSLGAFVRRQRRETIRHVCDLIRSGKSKGSDYKEAVEFIDNKWGVQEDVIMTCVAAARKADGPIIETGCGLTTVMMAAATDQTVYCIEHEDFFARCMKQMAYSAGLQNIALVTAPIRDGWYDIESDLGALPDRFAVGLNDGPPRELGDRMRFFDYFNPDVIIADDADNPEYFTKLTAWAKSQGRDIHLPEMRAAIIMEAA